MKRQQAVFLVAAALLLLSACAGVSGRQEKLQNRLLAYDHVVRWGELSHMYGFLSPTVKAAVPQGLENVQVTDYEPLSTVPLDKGKGVRRRVHIEYLHRDHQVVKSLTDEQLWRYDEKAGQWFRSNPPPEFR